MRTLTGVITSAKVKQLMIVPLDPSETRFAIDGRYYATNDSDPVRGVVYWLLRGCDQSVVTFQQTTSDGATRVGGGRRDERGRSKEGIVNRGNNGSGGRTT